MLFLSIARVLFAFAFSVIQAQILHTTPLWDTNVTSSHSDRVNAADAALSQVVNRLDLSGIISTDVEVAHTLHFYEALANFNIMTHQQNLSETTMAYFRQLGVNFDSTGRPVGFVRDIIQGGYTATRAYLSLGDDYLLDKAKEYWDIMNIYTISDSDLQSGRTSGRNFSLPRTCGSSTSGNYSLGGAVFQNASRESSVIDIYETGYFFLLSSILASAETPPNSTYVSAARASLDFLMQQPFVPRLGVTAVITAGFCGNISLLWPGGTSTVGFVIEGLSLLAVLGNDEDLYKLLLETIQRTFDQTGLGWPNAKGILLNYKNQSTSQIPEVLPDVVARDIEFVRGLAVAYRNATSLPSDIRGAIKTFLGVQYNAVRKLASIGDNLYDGSWQDPSSRTYSPSFDVVNQSFAAQVLIDGIDIFDEPLAVPPPTSSSSRVPVATLAGSIVGGVLFLVILIALAAFFYRRHLRRQSADSHTTQSSPSHLFPSPSIFVGPNTEVTPFEWDPEAHRESPLQDTKERPLSGDQNVNKEPVADHASLGERPAESPPAVSTPHAEDSDSPPDYRSQ
ncbi:hypothetical protein VNI00_007088 [Paramarasmius palmivorus]|uniref:Glycoside hydrolase family 76 protein n=1 Tax=Paramarasmius palmivorus TaxID=297713 RepID=A0AAW0D6M8_9AGAR